MANKSKAYEQKKARERAWYERRPQDRDGLVRGVLHHPMFFSYKRLHYNRVFPKRQMAAIARQLVGGRAERLLIAACGRGDDFTYLSDLSPHVYGIDLAAAALRSCPEAMKVALGDVLELPYCEGTFDLVASSLFFHHMLQFGFVPFLQEFYRVLKPGGAVVILEPSLWYPLNLITRPLKPIFGNPFDEVEDEGPFRPGIMLSSLKEAGFVNVGIKAATFSHCAFYVPLARLVNRLSRALLDVWPFTYLGWLVVYWAKRPEPANGV